MADPIRIIPCLDLDGGRVVKGVKFADLRDAGDPVELASRYCDEGADEITFLDVSATVEQRGTTLETLHQVAATLTMPITVGGGIRTLADAARLFEAGAAKVSVNTAAIARPDLLTEISDEFGSHAVVLSIDARRGDGGSFEVTTHGGRHGTRIDVLDWANRAEAAGVGEILLNSIDADGTEDGFNIEMLTAVRAGVECSIVASGGAGTPEHFVAAADAGANAVLAASVFHFQVVTIGDVKDALRRGGHVVL